MCKHLTCANRKRFIALLQNNTLKRIKMNKILLTLCATAFIFASCNKKGCIDSNANNYSQEATKDDGKCTYEATATIWFDQQTSIAWDLAGVTTLSVYVGEVLVTTHNVNTYWPTAPVCQAAGTINVTKNLNAATTSTISWEVKDQNGASLASGSWAAVGGQCTLIEAS